MDIDTIAKLVTVIAGVLGIIGTGLVILFGEKSLAELFKRWREKRKTKESHQSKPLENNSQYPTGVPRDSKKTENEERNREKIVSFSEQVKSGKYQQALNNALPERSKLEEKLSKENPDDILLLHDFDVWFARALIYTGKTNDGLEKLDTIISDLGNPERFSPTDRLVNEVLARAHNDRGYAYWMDKGNYELAIEEFNAAIKGFSLSCTTENEKKLLKGPWEELATAYDNLGRVYVQLGHQERAEIIIGHGQELREEICDHADTQLKNRAEYRYALSLNSKAVSHLAFGEPYDAYKLSDQALMQFRSLPEGAKSRGTGLATLTKGQSLREIGKRWKNDRQSRKSYFERVLNLSIKILEQAEEFFAENKEDSDRIWEPIRLCQIKNEIGCAHRELAELNDDLRIARKDGQRYLKAGKELAEQKFPLLFLDGCEDLARLHLLLGNEKLAFNELDSAEEKIRADYPSMHFFNESVDIKKLAPKDCIEEIWQYLGKIYALRGHIALNHSKPSSTVDDNLKEAVRNYILALGYFGLYAERAREFHFDKNKKIMLKGAEALELVSHKSFVRELYNKLKTRDSMVVNQIFDTVVPELTKKYKLKKNWINEFYNVADLIVQTKPPSS